MGVGQAGVGSFPDGEGVVFIVLVENEWDVKMNNNKKKHISLKDIEERTEVFHYGIKLFSTSLLIHIRHPAWPGNILQVLKNLFQAGIFPDVKMTMTDYVV